MFLELIATFIAGLAAAGVTMLLNKVTGGRLPKWSVPVVAGLVMIATTIGSEYNWFDRTRASLPTGVEVVTTVESRAAYRPWTYVFPFVTRFIAIDREAIQTNAETPQLRLVQLYAYGRWQTVRAAQIMVDCEKSARADPTDGQAPLVWRDLGADDPVIAAVCSGA